MQAVALYGRVRPWAPGARSLVTLCACILFTGRAAKVREALRRARLSAAS